MKILVVDDEALLVKGIRFNLQNEGYEVITGSDGLEAIRLVQEQNPDLVVLDVMMPHMDGMTACSKIRENSDIPIILLTAKTDDMDKLMGFDHGADDYLTKPFNILELKARIRALLRRSGARERQTAGNLLTIGSITLDLDARNAYRSGELADLTAKEFDVVEFLMRNPNRVYSREALLDTIWSYEYRSDIRTVDVHIRRLREKLEKNPAEPNHIMTKWALAITSESKRTVFRRYGTTQFRYAMTYVLITSFVLLILNIYCSSISQTLFSRSKQASMTERCRLTADEVSKLEVLNADTLAGVVQAMDLLTEQGGVPALSRILITDRSGLVLYDNTGEIRNGYALLPEILRALDGNDVFLCQYRSGAMQSHAVSPVLYYGSVIGCVYMMEYDTVQGALIESLQNTVLRITLVLEIVVILFSVAFSNTFSRRMRRIMASMRIIQEGDYSHKVVMGGNDELTVLGNEFNDLTERLQTSEQKRRRFVSDASHELKTPLASIKLLSDSILQNDMDQQTIREFVSDIGDEAERLNRMTAKLLSLTKVDGDVDTESEIICMKPTILRVERMLSTLADQAQVDIELGLEGDAPVLILEDDLYQIVFNLMENGIKYNIPGGRLYVTLSRDEENAYLTIRDTGMGIPEEALTHIFERFYRVDKARSRQSGGSGLGLAIVRAIVERYRGEIRVESVPEQGTVFTVSFPAFDTEVDQA